MPPLEPDERGRSDGLMGYVAGVIRGQLRKRKTSSYRLPELVRPDGAGYMALYCAAQWIATRGGTLEINPLDRIASEDVKVVGVRDGATETVSGIHFASCSVVYPFSDSRLDQILSKELCLFSRPYLDDEHWRKGFDDSLEDRRGARWRRLMVLKADVARYWPFDIARPADVTPLVTGAPGRPTSMHLVELEHRDRWQRGEAETSIGAEAAALANWLRTEHPHAPPLTPKTIANKLRHDYRRRGAEARK
jgi:hypothetical protein